LKIRYKRPDKKNALSILEASRRDMKFTLSIKVTKESGPTMIRNIYECFRMLGDALLVAKGMKSEDHIAPITELLKIRADTTRPVGVIDNLRRLRHNINYYGYKPKIIEVEDAVSIAESCFEPLFNAILKEVR
jgi:hypothetical protein